MRGQWGIFLFPLHKQILFILRLEGQKKEKEKKKKEEIGPSLTLSGGSSRRQEGDGGNP